MTGRVLRSEKVYRRVRATMPALRAARGSSGRRPKARAESQHGDGFHSQRAVAVGAAIVLLALRLPPLVTSFTRDPGAPNPLLNGLWASVGTNFLPLILAAYTVGVLCPLLKGKGSPGGVTQNRFRMPERLFSAHGCGLPWARSATARAAFANAIPARLHLRTPLLLSTAASEPRKVRLLRQGDPPPYRLP